MGLQNYDKEIFYKELLEIHPGRYPPKEHFFGDIKLEDIRKPPSFFKKLLHTFI